MASYKFYLNLLFFNICISFLFAFAKQFVLVSNDSVLLPPDSQTNTCKWYSFSVSRDNEMTERQTAFVMLWFMTRCVPTWPDKLWTRTEKKNHRTRYVAHLGWRHRFVKYQIQDTLINVFVRKGTDGYVACRQTCFGKCNIRKSGV